jgi:hypothetical protein
LIIAPFFSASAPPLGYMRDAFAWCEFSLFCLADIVPMAAFSTNAFAFCRPMRSFLL